MNRLLPIHFFSSFVKSGAPRDVSTCEIGAGDRSGARGRHTGSVATDEDGDLPPKEAKFVQEYLVDLNATQAALRSGYSAPSAHTTGWELLQKPKVAAAIAEAKRRRVRKTRITQERVLHELALLAFSDFTHYEVDDEGKLTTVAGAPVGARRAVSSVKRKVRYGPDGTREVEIELKLWDKPGPLKLAGRHVGLFPDRIEVTGKDGGPLETSTLTTAERAARANALMAKAGGAPLFQVGATPDETDDPADE